MSKPHTFPSVSVVIGAYNAAAWIAETLESVLAQTLPVLEILVIDDGSTDGTAGIVQAYGGRVTYLHEAHRGRPHRNRGIQWSRGEVVAFVDADDLWHPTKVEKQLQLLQARRAQWAICDSQWLDEASGQISAPIGPPPGDGDILEALFLNNFIVASTAVVARRVLDEIGYFDETAEVAPIEDWDLWLRIAAKYPVACLPERLVTLRLHSDSFLAATPLARRVRSLENVIGRASAREPERLEALKGRALSNVYYAAGVKMFREKRLGEARRYFLNAWRQSPIRPAPIAYLMTTLLGEKVAGTILGLRHRPGRGR